MRERDLRELEVLDYKILNLHTITRGKQLQIIPFYSEWSSNSRLWSHITTTPEFSLLDIVDFKEDKKKLFFEVTSIMEACFLSFFFRLARMKCIYFELCKFGNKKYNHPFWVFSGLEKKLNSFFFRTNFKIKFMSYFVAKNLFR